MGQKFSKKWVNFQSKNSGLFHLGVGNVISLIKKDCINWIDKIIVAGPHLFFGAIFANGRPELEYTLSDFISTYLHLMIFSFNGVLCISLFFMDYKTLVELRRWY